MRKYEYSNYLHYIPLIYRHCALDNFDFSDQDEKLIVMIEKFLESGEKGLFLYGGFGVGKTHLLVSLYRIVLAKEVYVSDALYISFEKIMKELISLIERKEPVSDFMDYIYQVKWLFLDDLTAVSLKDYPLDILRKIINSRYEMKLFTCFSSNSDLESLGDDGLHPHAISRIGSMCEVIQILGRDRRRL